MIPASFILKFYGRKIFMNRLNGTSPLGRYEIADGSTVEPGYLVALDGSGKAVPAADTAGLKVVGIAKAVDDGEVEVCDGIVSMANGASAAALARTDRGAVVYVVDSGTVGKTSTNKIPAGIMVDLYDGEVYFVCDPVALSGALLVAAHAAQTSAAGHASA